MKVYIRASDGVYPDNDWLISAYLGFKERGFKIILFQDAEEIPFSKDNIAVDWIEDTYKYFEKNGISVRKSLNIPEELKKFRKVEFMKMKDFLLDTRVPIFIKPDGKAKSFPSGVVKNNSNKKLLFSDVDPEESCMISEVIDIVSEYRCYILRGEIIGIYNYLGNIFKFPDPNSICDFLDAYKSAPIAYSLDVAVTSANETIFLECNDAWSLGNYGLDAQKYSKMLEARWKEIMEKNN